MKAYQITFWISSIIIFLMEGLMPLSTLIFAPEYFNAGTKPLGYPDYFALALIVCKIAGSLVLILPFIHAKIKEWAYAGLTFNLVFAVISHMAVDKNISYILMPVVVLVVLALSYISYHKLRTGKNG